VEITQQQYNADILKDKVWSDYNAFKKEFKKLYGKNPDALSDDSEDVMLFFIIVITFSIVLSLFCFSALLNRDERGRFRF
jgi:hypothetical protein